MRISAKADYAVRAVVELAAAEGDKPVKAERVATAQEIPLNFLENILGELRHAGIVRSHRGAEGGFRLAKPANEVTVADVIRAVEGPLASVRGGPPEDAKYGGAATTLPHGVDRGAGQPAPRRRARHDRRHRQLQAPTVDREADRGPGGLGHTLTSARADPGSDADGAGRSASAGRSRTHACPTSRSTASIAAAAGER